VQLICLIDVKAEVDALSVTKWTTEWLTVIPTVPTKTWEDLHAIRARSLRVGVP